jgi:hypothetical protein
MSLLAMVLTQMSHQIYSFGDIYRETTTTAKQKSNYNKEMMGTEYVSGSSIPQDVFFVDVCLRHFFDHYKPDRDNSIDTRRPLS